VADAQALLASARDQCYLDPLAARESGRALAACDGALAAWGWLHVALAEVRVGEASASAQAVAKARQAFEQAADTRGLLWCDEVEAILLRRTGDYAGSARRQALLDAQPEHAQAQADDPLLGFVAHNSRAITAKLQGQIENALRHLYAASDAAQRTSSVGPRITALGNLGGFHHDLYNLDDARRLSEEALAAGREAGARQSVTTVAVNLILIYHALGEVAQARAMAEFVLTHQDELVPDAVNRYALPLALGHLGVGEIPAATACLEAGAVAGVADGDGMVMWAWLKARCLLAQGDAKQARAVAERTLQQRRERRLSDPPYEMMELQRALADACESLGDSAAALACMRQAHKGYEQLVGRSARARYIALDVGHQLAQAQRERDMAVVSHRSADDDRRRLSELNTALQAQIAETEMLHAKLREQALRDPLTGLHNRRYLFEMAPALLELARRQGQPLCVVLLDLDHFKLLNDTYGHHAGDLVLQRFALLLTQILRRSDVVCRHGGEEFVAVMPDIDAEGTQAVLARLLEAFQQSALEVGRRRLPGGSFSAGVALFPRHGHTLEQLLSRADRALYAAKKQGRARIEMAPRTGFGTLV
jgi:diguanylate cyclase (GGDEF)-like protein